MTTISFSDKFSMIRNDDSSKIEIRRYNSSHEFVYTNWMNDLFSFVEELISAKDDCQPKSPQLPTLTKFIFRARSPVNNWQGMWYAETAEEALAQLKASDPSTDYICVGVAIC